MRKLFVIFLTLMLVLSLAAVAGCAGSSGNAEEDEAELQRLLQSGVGNEPTGDGQDQDAAQEEPDEPQKDDQARNPPESNWYLSCIIDETIDIGAAQGSPGMFAQYVFEFHLRKLGGAYPSGAYRTDVQSSMRIDATEFFEEFFKDLPGIAGGHLDVEVSAQRINELALECVGYWEYGVTREVFPFIEDEFQRRVIPGEEDYIITEYIELMYEGESNTGGWAETGGGSGTIGDIITGGEKEVVIHLFILIDPDEVWGDALFSDEELTRKASFYVYLSDGTWLSGEGALKRSPL